MSLYICALNTTMFLHIVEIIECDTILLIFDEIQEVPQALTSLKYFTENASEYQIVCAGSLLGVALHTGTNFPVGKVDLYPLSFPEFLKATGNERYEETRRFRYGNLV